MKYIYLDVKRWEVLKLSYQIIDCTGIEGVWVYRAFQFSLRGPTLTHFSGVGRPSQREAGENWKALLWVYRTPACCTVMCSNILEQLRKTSHSIYLPRDRE